MRDQLLGFQAGQIQGVSDTLEYCTVTLPGASSQIVPRLTSLLCFTFPTALLVSPGGILTKVKGEDHSVVSDSLRPQGLYSPWNSPGQNTGVGSLSLLQGIFPTQGSNLALSHCRWILYQLSHQRSPSLNKSLHPNPRLRVCFGGTQGMGRSRPKWRAEWCP